MIAVFIFFPEKASSRDSFFKGTSLGILCPDISPKDSSKPYPLDKTELPFHFSMLELLLLALHSFGG